MSDDYGYRTITTITFGSRNNDPLPLWGWVVLSLLALAVAAAVTLAIGGASVGFDGMLGSGCDAGNRLCTFREWRKGCSDEDVRAHVCNLPEFARQGGKP